MADAPCGGFYALGKDSARGRESRFRPHKARSAKK